MNSKLVNIALIFTIIGLLGLVFYVKKDATAQAKDFVRGKLTAANDLLVKNKELNESNAVLWELAFETALEKPEKKAFVVSAKKLDTGKDSKYSITAVKENTSHWRVSHKWAGFEVKFDSKGKFESINIQELLGAVE